MKRGRGHTANGRSEGSGQFVQIYYAMAQSDAFRSLSGPAVKVFIELRSRFHMKTKKQSNNGDISISLDEAKRLLHIGKTTAMRALVELEEKGFITKTKAGHWYGRMAATYALTDRKCGSGPATNSWRNWQPRENQKSVPRRNIFGPETEHIS